MLFNRCLSLILLTCLVLAACAGPRMAQDLQGGKASFESGDYKEAFHRLLPLAVNGNAEAQYAVGYMYYYGYGVSEDTESGIFWMTKAAEQHYPPAIRALQLLCHPTAESQSVIPARQKSPYEAYRERVLRQQAVPIVIEQPPPPPPEKLSYTQQKIDPARQYALQLYGSYHLDAVKNLQMQLQLKHTGHIYQTTHNGKNWYVLTFGHFASAREASATGKNLPADLKGMHPWVRDVDALQLV
ncbi:MAG TPA: SPOR domain-containing protein [Gammaproteobacteria bacterium]|nr:SPOR domain-containing protein [Gammaproteobacteria bacterium]